MQKLIYGGNTGQKTVVLAGNLAIMEEMIKTLMKRTLFGLKERLV